MPALPRTLLLGALALPLAAQGLHLPPVGPAARQDEPARACAPVPSPSQFPGWQDLPLQTTTPDPFLPLAYTTLDNANGSSAADFARAVMEGRAPGRVASPDEWYRCRRPEILRLLQEYQYGYYPDRAGETDRALLRHPGAARRRQRREPGTRRH
ncbi:hypothetical protein DL764_009818 [Monosporascus ibericus]|uniref:Uncharacterized protein n=1 Tax=Monosporascus ibericus TaxID=155417 RepID=A0A4Q4SU26_9PEZI|nr:hypothetical protein DL764_009818 [Monosporascus ibericus]